MKFELADITRAELQTFQRKAGSRSEYVKVKCLLMLDKGYGFAEISECLGIDKSTVHRYRASFESDGLKKYLQTNYQGSWGLLSSKEILRLRAEINRTLYTDSKQIIAWVEAEFPRPVGSFQPTVTTYR